MLRPFTAVRANHRHGGFSFTEILFAVMILGIGFIMVAAIFPVAIAQTKASQEESVAAAIVRNAVGSIDQIVPIQFLPPTGTSPVSLSLLRPTVPVTGGPTNINDFYVAGLNPTTASAIGGGYPVPATVTTQTIPGWVWPVGLAQSLAIPGGAGMDAVKSVGSVTLPSQLTLDQVIWPMVSQNMIETTDARYAWVAFYKRDLIESGIGTPHVLITFAPTLQLIVVAVRSTAKPNYEASEVKLSPTPNTLQPVMGINTTFTPSGGANFATTVSISDATCAARAVEGAFIIIASDSLSSTTPTHGALNGHFYRLGTKDPSGNWQLAPGYDLTSSDRVNMGGGESFTIYIIGRAQDPNQNNQYSGLAQDIAVYSTFLACGNN